MGEVFLMEISKKVSTYLTYFELKNFFTYILRMCTEKSLFGMSWVTK